MKVLVTGGAGYIGSHTCAVFARHGLDVTIFDNFSKSAPETADRIETASGRTVKVIVGDVLDSDLLLNVLRCGSYDAVVHFAGLKSIGESLTDPLAYYRTNVIGTLNLLDAIKVTSTRIFVFSSSASVYGSPTSCPVHEDARIAPTNPYAQTKCIVENVMTSLHAADPTWRFAALRYFNPVGAHESGLLGEEPTHEVSNLLPVALEVALQRRSELLIYGDDYPTDDGTGVRDYIHVMDLAEGHLAALRYLTRVPDTVTVNLGTGRGISVLQMVTALERASRVDIQTRIVPRRAGDVAACYADVERAKNLLGWQAVRTVEDMCADAWRWASIKLSGRQSN